MSDQLESASASRQTVLVVVAACGLTVAVLVLAVAMAVASYRATVGVARQNARFASSLVAGQMAMVLLDLEDSLEEVGRALEVFPDREVGDHDQILRNLLAGLQRERSYIRALFITDDKGRITDWTDQGQMPDVSARDYIAAHHSGTRGAFVGAPVINLRQPGDWVFGVSLGLRNEGGELVRIAVLLVGLDPLLETFQDLDLPQGVRLAVTDMLGRVYLYAPGYEHYVGRTAPGMENYHRLKDQGSTYVGPSPMDGIEVVMGSTPVNRYPLLAFAGFHLEQVLAPWRREAMAYGGAALALVAVAGSLSVLLVRGQVRLARQGHELALLASQDALTGALNRRAFMIDAHREFSRVRRYGGELSCLMFDLDHFKSINDSYGHAAGDLALTTAAGFIRTRLRTPDLFCRWGGEEFVMLLPGTDLDGAVHLAESLREGLSRLELETEGLCFTLTASFGVAVVLASDASVEELLNRSDQAMYKAKDDGRNCVRKAALPSNWA